MVDLVRIDDRLVHGQVMAAWAPALRTTHILVADDDSAADDFARQIMQLAMPAHIALTIETVDSAASRLPAIAADASHTLVLLKSVAAAVRLHHLWPLVSLNVGGIGMAPGRALVWRSIAASPQEVAALQRLRAQGVDVYFQMVPGDTKQVLSA